MAPGLAPTLSVARKRPAAGLIDDATQAATTTAHDSVALCVVIDQYGLNAVEILVHQVPGLGAYDPACVRQLHSV
jgi:hypothetical protein